MLKTPGNSKNNILRDQQTKNKRTLMFLNVKVLTEKKQ